MIVVILSSTASAAVSAFAFAQASSFLRLGDISVTTLTPAKIQIGLKNSTTGAIDYYDNLTEGSFTSSGQASPLNHGFYPVSSSFKEKWLVKDGNGTYDSLLPKFTKEYINNDFYVNGADQACYFPGYASSSSYLSMEIYLKEMDTESFPVNMYLDPSTYIKPDSAKNAEAAGANGALKAAELDKITDSMRISILTSDNYYIVDPFKSGDTYLAGRLNILGNDSYYDTYSGMFGNGAYTDKEALYGEYTGDVSSLVWDDPASVDTTLSGTATCFNGQTKAGVYALDITKSTGVKLKAEDSVRLSDFAYDAEKKNNTPLVSLEPGEEKRIVISYYVEGWDLDNINSVQYASFLSSIKLKGVYDYAVS